MNLESDPILYAGLNRVLKRGTAEILEENESVIFLRDSISDMYMLVAKHPEESIEWLIKYEHRHYEILLLFQEEVVNFARKRYNFTQTLICYQAAYLSSQFPTHDYKLEIKQASDNDYGIISSIYDKLDEKDLKKGISLGNLFIGSHNGQIVGFVGQHLEGSMGILEVLEQYRGNGYGKELERFMIEHMLREGILPFCQVETDNEKSLNLQKSLGLTISKDKVYFVF